MYLFCRSVIFRELIQLLNKLQVDGIILNLGNDIIKFVRFKLLSVLGDNFGMNGILGFTECFVANHSCRFCRIEKKGKKHCIENKTLMRDKSNYKINLKLNDLSKTGIKEECVFHYVDDFHVTTNKSVDIMHDLLEGLCRIEMILIIIFWSTVFLYISL